MGSRYRLILVLNGKLVLTYAGFDLSKDASHNHNGWFVLCRIGYLNIFQHS